MSLEYAQKLGLSENSNRSAITTSGRTQQTDYFFDGRRQEANSINDTALKVSPFQNNLLKSNIYQLGRVTGPIKVLGKIVEDWQLDIQVVTSILGFEANEQQDVNRILKGSLTLKGRDKNARLSYLFGIHYGLRSLYQNPEAEKRWLNSPKDMLNGSTPLEFLLDGSIEKLIGLKNFVDFVTGRR